MAVFWQVVSACANLEAVGVLQWSRLLQDSSRSIFRCCEIKYKKGREIDHKEAELRTGIVSHPIKGDLQSFFDSPLQ